MRIDVVHDHCRSNENPLPSGHEKISRAECDCHSIDELSRSTGEAAKWTRLTAGYRKRLPRFNAQSNKRREKVLADCSFDKLVPIFEPSDSR